MSRCLAHVVAALGLVACSGDAPRAPDPTPAPAPELRDAAAAELPASGVFDPAAGRHVDDDLPPVAPVTPGRPAGRALRPIDVTLRSTPPGATAAVDGVPIGVTPTYWAGDANGRPHEFTFVAPHYTVARYRFVPVSSGVLFAKLEPVTSEEPPAAPAGPVAPAPVAPAGPAAPPPVPTVIAPRPPPSPPDAAPPPPPVDATEVGSDAPVVDAPPLGVGPLP